MKTMDVWVLTNLGGKNLFFQDYSGRLPIFFTRKEAEKEKERLDAAPGKIQERVMAKRTGGRRIVKARLSYVV